MSEDRINVSEFLGSIAIRMDELDRRFEGLEQNFKAFESTTEANFENVRQHLSDQDEKLIELIAVSREMRDALASVMDVVREHHDRFSSIDERLAVIEGLLQ